MRLFNHRQYFLLLIFAVIVILAAISARSFGVISADTWALFFASVFGGVATLTAVMISYCQNQNMHEEMQMHAAEERRQAMRPYITIQIEPLNLLDYHGKIANRMLSAEEIFRKIVGVDVCLRIEAGENSTPLRPLFEPRYLTECLDQYKYTGPAYYHRLITITNIGEGTAHSLSISVQSRPWHNGLTLAKNGTLKILGDISSVHGGDVKTNYPLVFTLEYSDLAGRRYRQEISCEVNMNPYATLNPPKVGVPQLMEDER